jgi:CRISPR-associated protein Cmr1
MFLAGADGQTPELRAPSIKGAMRFWWRAMNGHLEVNDLKQKESKIFGGVGDGQTQSRIIIRAQCEEFTPSYEEFNHVFYTYDGNRRRNQGRAFPTNPMFYLAYGPANWVREEKKTMFIRPYIPTNTKFIIKIVVKEDEIVTEVLDTVKILEQFGGLGAKSRNAFGCFQIIECRVNDLVQHLETIPATRFSVNQLSEFTSISGYLSFFETKKIDFSNWEDAFKNICIAYQFARENIEPWHEWYVRELIGLPIVVQNERGDSNNFLERHAKPYFMHVTRVNNKFKGEILLLPYNYLSKNPEISPDKFEPYKRDYLAALNQFNSLLEEKLTLVAHKTL